MAPHNREYQKIRSQNETEMKQCQVRDRDEKQALVSRQLKERQNLQTQISHTTQEHKLEISNLRQDISRYIEIGVQSQQILREEYNKSNSPKDRSQGYEPERQPKIYCHQR